MPNLTKLLFHYNMKVSVKANQNITCAVFLMIHLLSEYLIQHMYIMFFCPSNNIHKTWFKTNTIMTEIVHVKT